MEIETKIFDTKKIRKILKKKKILPHRVSDIVDYFFDLDNFSPISWKYEYVKQNKSGKIIDWNIAVEVPDVSTLKKIQIFFKISELRGCKMRIRVIDWSPYFTLKWRKNTSKWIKTRDEFEISVNSLSLLMNILLNSGAILIKSLSKTREIFFSDSMDFHELIIDSFVIAGERFEYAEIECTTYEKLQKVLYEDFGLNESDLISSWFLKIYNSYEDSLKNKRMEDLLRK